MASWARKLTKRFGARGMLKVLRWWPPFLGAGIRVRAVSDDLRTIEVELPLHRWNKNYVGTQFGGSLYAMCDPFFMLILIENLGPEYIVWDKAATIRFRKPGRGTVRARFHVSEEQIAGIRRDAEVQPKVEPKFLVEVRDNQGMVIAEIEKLLYIKKREHRSLESTTD